MKRGRPSWQNVPQQPAEVAFNSLNTLLKPSRLYAMLASMEVVTDDDGGSMAFQFGCVSAAWMDRFWDWLGTFADGRVVRSRSAAQPFDVLFPSLSPADLRAFQAVFIVFAEATIELAAPVSYYTLTLPRGNISTNWLLQHGHMWFELDLYPQVEEIGDLLPDPNNNDPLRLYPGQEEAMGEDHRAPGFFRDPVERMVRRLEPVPDQRRSLINQCGLRALHFPQPLRGGVAPPPPLAPILVPPMPAPAAPAPNPVPRGHAPVPMLVDDAEDSDSETAAGSPNDSDTEPGDSHYRSLWDRGLVALGDLAERVRAWLAEVASAVDACGPELAWAGAMGPGAQPNATGDRHAYIGGAGQQNPMGPAGPRQPFVGFVDVGQGNMNALFDHHGRLTVLFDCGKATKANYEPAGGMTYPCLCHLELVVLSHWDKDHIQFGMTLDAAMHARWVAPQQDMHTPEVKNVISRVLTEGGEFYLYCASGRPANVATDTGGSHMRMPWGFLERCDNPAYPNPLTYGPDPRNNCGITMHVCVAEAAHSVAQALPAQAPARLAAAEPGLFPLVLPAMGAVVRPTGPGGLGVLNPGLRKPEGRTARAAVAAAKTLVEGLIERRIAVAAPGLGAPVRVAMAEAAARLALLTFRLPVAALSVGVAAAALHPAALDEVVDHAGAVVDLPPAGRAAGLGAMAAAAARNDLIAAAGALTPAGYAVDDVAAWLAGLATAAHGAGLRAAVAAALSYSHAGALSVAAIVGAAVHALPAIEAAQIAQAAYQAAKHAHPDLRQHAAAAAAGAATVAAAHWDVLALHAPFAVANPAARIGAVAGILNATARGHLAATAALATGPAPVAAVAAAAPVAGNAGRVTAVTVATAAAITVVAAEEQAQLPQAPVTATQLLTGMRATMVELLAGFGPAGTIAEVTEALLLAGAGTRALAAAAGAAATAAATPTLIHDIVTDVVAELAVPNTTAVVELQASAAIAAGAPVDEDACDLVGHSVAAVAHAEEAVWLAVAMAEAARQLIPRIAFPVDDAAPIREAEGRQAVVAAVDATTPAAYGHGAVLAEAAFVALWLSREEASRVLVAAVGAVAAAVSGGFIPTVAEAAQTACQAHGAVRAALGGVPIGTSTAGLPAALDHGLQQSVAAAMGAGDLKAFVGALVAIAPFNADPVAARAVRAAIYGAAASLDILEKLPPVGRAGSARAVAAATAALTPLATAAAVCATTVTVAFTNPMSLSATLATAAGGAVLAPAQQQAIIREAAELVGTNGLTLANGAPTTVVGLDALAGLAAAAPAADAAAQVSADAGVSAVMDGTTGVQLGVPASLAACLAVRALMGGTVTRAARHVEARRATADAILAVSSVTPAHADAIAEAAVSVLEEIERPGDRGRFHATAAGAVALVPATTIAEAHLAAKAAIYSVARFARVADYVAELPAALGAAITALAPLGAIADQPLVALANVRASAALAGQAAASSATSAAVVGSLAAMALLYPGMTHAPAVLATRAALVASPVPNLTPSLVVSAIAPPLPLPLEGSAPFDRDNERFVLLTGDANYRYIPAQQHPTTAPTMTGPPTVVGLAATHHGSKLVGDDLLVREYIPWAPGSKPSRACAAAVAAEARPGPTADRRIVAAVAALAAPSVAANIIAAIAHAALDVAMAAPAQGLRAIVAAAGAAGLAAQAALPLLVTDIVNHADAAVAANGANLNAATVGTNPAAAQAALRLIGAVAANTANAPAAAVPLAAAAAGPLLAPAVQAATLAAAALAAFAAPAAADVTAARNGVESALRAGPLAEPIVTVLSAAIGVDVGGAIIQAARGRKLVVEMIEALRGLQPAFNATLTAAIPGATYAALRASAQTAVAAIPGATYTALNQALNVIGPVRVPFGNVPALVAGALGVSVLAILEAQVNGARFMARPATVIAAHRETAAVLAGLGTANLVVHVLAVQESSRSAGLGAVAGGPGGATAHYPEAAATKIAYAYGHSRVSGRHDYTQAYDGHPNQLAIDMYESRGWTHRLNANAEADDSRQPSTGKNGWCAVGWEDVPGEYRGPLRSGETGDGLPAWEREISACLTCGSDQDDFIG